MHFSTLLNLLVPAAVTALAISKRDVNTESTLARRAPPLGQIIYSCQNPGQVALTFDDGPYFYTSALLDVLDDLGVKATFFLVGSNFGRNMAEGEWPGVLQRMHDAGHQLASHTWAHPDLSTISSAERASQMQLNDQAFRSVLGFAPTYMRPPFLSCDEGCVADMADLGYYVIDTDLDTSDWQNNTPETIGNSKAIFDDSLGFDTNSRAPIVLTHDVHETTVTELTPHMVATIRERGFEPVTVGECLGDSPDGWYRG